MTHSMTLPKGPSERCRLCGTSDFGKGPPIEHRLKATEETESSQEAVVRLCRPCAEDFSDEDERDAYLERLVA